MLKLIIPEKCAGSMYIESTFNSCAEKIIFMPSTGQHAWKMNLQCRTVLSLPPAYKQLSSYSCIVNSWFVILVTI